MSFGIAVVIKMTIMLAFAGLATLALKWAPASTRYAVWTIALLCGLFLPFTSALLPRPARIDFPVLPVNQSDAVIVRSPGPAPGAAAATTVSPSAMAAQATTDSRPLSQWISIAWAVGAAFFLSRLIVAMLAARRLVRRSTPMTTQTWNLLMNELRSELSIRHPVELRDGGTTPPLTWGLFRHSVLLPSDANSWPVEQQRSVLAHELAHAKRHDGLTQILVGIVTSVYWFNPCVWMAARRMKLERECACDDFAIHVGTKAGAYANHLLSLACRSGNTTLAAVSIAHPSQLEVRLRAILNPKTRRGRLSRGASWILASLAVALVFSVSAIHVTSLLSLSLPTSFRAMAAPLVILPKPDPQQQPTAPATPAGSVAGRVVWTDGAASAGATVSAIATSTEGLPSAWVMGIKVAGSTITGSDGRYRIENLPSGLYHIVTGPVYLPRTFSDVVSAVVSTSGTHLVTVTPGKTADIMDFTCVRNPEGKSYEAARMLTITGKLVFASFGGPRTPSVMINNDDGSVSYWQFRGVSDSRYPGNFNTFYWWPGFDAALGGPLDTMAKAGETVTITGTDNGYSGNRNGLHILAVQEVTRGGLPAR